MNPSKHDQIWRDWMAATDHALQPEHAPRPATLSGHMPAGMAALASIAIVVAVLGSRLMASPAVTGSSPSASAGGSPSASPSGVAQPSGATPSPAPTASGAFRLTGSMTTARYGQTATRLAGGLVLIVGGGLNETDANIQDAYASAELYDPASGAFMATGSMHAARGNHTATLLTDGRVLIAGGSGSDNVGRAEIYDPASGTFSVTGTVGTIRSGAMAVLLHDGRVLIAGGFLGGTPPTPLASAELYDPATGKFSPAGSMSSARQSFTVTPLQDGRVLIAGGFDAFGELASAELFDPKTGTFAATGSMSDPRSGPAIALSDGRVLILGDSTAELYDPRTGTFAATGSMSTVQRLPAETLLTDGRVLIAGGFDPDQNALATAELFEP